MQVFGTERWLQIFWKLIATDPESTVATDSRLEHDVQSSSILHQLRHLVRTHLVTQARPALRPSALQHVRPSRAVLALFASCQDNNHPRTSTAMRGGALAPYQEQHCSCRWAAICWRVRSMSPTSRTSSPATSLLTSTSSSSASSSTCSALRAFEHLRGDCIGSTCYGAGSAGFWDGSARRVLQSKERKQRMLSGRPWAISLQCRASRGCSLQGRLQQHAEVRMPGDATRNWGS